VNAATAVAVRAARPIGFRFDIVLPIDNAVVWMTALRHMLVALDEGQMPEIRFDVAGDTEAGGNLARRVEAIASELGIAVVITCSDGEVVVVRPAAD